MKIVADANIPFVRECFSSVGEVEVLSGRDITAAGGREGGCSAGAKHHAGE